MDRNPSKFYGDLTRFSVGFDESELGIIEGLYTFRRQTLQ